MDDETEDEDDIKTLAGKLKKKKNKKKKRQKS